MSRESTRVRRARSQWRALPAWLLVALLFPWPARSAGLSLAEAVALARQAAPALRAADASLAGANAARPAATTLPDPRLIAGIDNLPVTGTDAYSTTRDPMTMQRIGLMQEVPNRAKRDARAAAAEARIERERSAHMLTALTVRRDAALAWLGVYYAGRRLDLLAELQHENRLLQQMLPARIAAGSAMPGDLTMARQEALAIADRGDEMARDLKRARAELRRWVGPRADEPLEGGPEWPGVDPAQARAALPRHAELAPLGASRALAAAEMAEADAERHGDWAWEVAYSVRPRYDNMVSFQLSFDLPWQRDQRQQPLVEAKRREIERIEAEREDLERRHAAELETMLADAAALDAQIERLKVSGLALAAERVRLALAGYQSGRGDLAAVLAARTQAVDLRLRVVDLEAQRTALQVRLGTLIAE